MIILLFGIVLTKKSVKEHMIVLRLDMKCSLNPGAVFDALTSMFIQLESLSYGPHSQKTNLGIFFVFQIYRFFKKFR